jgi:hypothetical protein
VNRTLNRGWTRINPAIPKAKTLLRWMLTALAGLIGALLAYAGYTVYRTGVFNALSNRGQNKSRSILNRPDCVPSSPPWTILSHTLHERQPRRRPKINWPDVPALSRKESLN